MKRMIKYNDIGTFEASVKKLRRQVQYTGLDEDGKAIYDSLAKLPNIEVWFTEKIHGTNAAVCYSIPDGFWVQSREGIKTLESDNAGCCQAAMKREASWMDIINALAKYHKIDLKKNIISLYYEWCGGSIQKKSAVTGLEKRAIIFNHFKVSPLDPQVDENGDTLQTDRQPAKWYETIVGEEVTMGMFGQETKVVYGSDAENDIYNITDYNVWKYAVDFENALLHNNEFLELLHKIELASPVGKAMGKEENVAEGMVGTFKFEDVIYKFKVKGEEHTTSKVKTLKPVDNVLEQKKIDLAAKVVTPGRCEQGWQLIHGIDNELKEPSKSNLGDFLSWIHRDIIKECMPLYNEANLEIKEVNQKISMIAKLWFFEQLQKDAF